MDRSFAADLCVAALFALATAACASTRSAQVEDALSAGRELSDEEQALARQIAEQSLRDQNMLDGRVYFVEAGLFREKAADDQPPTDSLARVSHYRYEDDAAILSYVNLTRQETTDVQAVEHLPIALSGDEFAIARDMALADPAVRRALGAEVDRVVVEPLLLRAASEDDPIFGQRVVRLLFRLGKDYRSEPNVTVNLTEERVIIENAQGPR
jgi:hypothetical protein